MLFAINPKEKKNAGNIENKIRREVMKESFQFKNSEICKCEMEISQ